MLCQLWVALFNFLYNETPWECKTKCSVCRRQWLLFSTMPFLFLVRRRLLANGSSAETAFITYSGPSLCQIFFFFPTGYNCSLLICPRPGIASVLFVPYFTDITFVHMLMASNPLYYGLHPVTVF